MEIVLNWKRRMQLIIFRFCMSIRWMSVLWRQKLFPEVSQFAWRWLLVLSSASETGKERERESPLERQKGEKQWGRFTKHECDNILMVSTFECFFCFWYFYIISDFFGLENPFLSFQEIACSKRWKGGQINICRCRRRRRCPRKKKETPRHCFPRYFRQFFASTEREYPPSLSLEGGGGGSQHKSCKAVFTPFFRRGKER